ncbi:MAG: ABC transporter substrate-binding protein, partial [Desulfobacterales bacterium]|nr:ABC transporter substrate-binding protein [Desulfobacterales bacterium]
MKIFKHCLIIIFFLFFLAFILSCKPSEPEGDFPYKIGVNLELTGPYANITQTLVMAMEMEVERINQMGGINGHPLELIIEDNGFDLAKASANIPRSPWHPRSLWFCMPLPRRSSPGFAPKD